jgi:peptide/nickel transport system permease protein
LARVGYSIGLSEPFIEKAGLLKKKTVQTWGVFRRNRMGMLGLIILLAFIFMAVFPGQIMWVLAKIGGWEFPYGPFDEVATVGMGTEPSSEHWLGTDLRGNDILARTIYGAQVSLTVGIVATAVSMGLGALVGLLSGFWGGWRDEALMRVTDVFLVLPWLVLMIVLAAVLPGGASVGKIILVIGITGWSSTARIVRAQVLSIKKRAFIERARAVGSGDLYIVRRHVFPNVFPLVFANSILTVALSILSESTLSFIGLGPDATNVVTWGNKLDDATTKAHAIENGLIWWVIVPGMCIVLVVLGFTFVGYALDEIFNPKLRKR